MFFLFLTLVFVWYFFRQAPISQRANYHDFADQRTWLRIPNAMNVLSNLPLLLVGLAGAWFVLRQSPSLSEKSFIDPLERWPYAAFFASVALVGLGSSYYHWEPGNSTLFLDRLPMVSGNKLFSPQGALPFPQGEGMPLSKKICLSSPGKRRFHRFFVIPSVAAEPRTQRAGYQLSSV